MKNTITTLVIMVLSLSVFGQTFQKSAITSSQARAGMKPVSKAQMNALKNSRLPVNSGSRALQALALDYGSLDEIYTIDNSGNFDGFIYNLNTNYDASDPSIFGLTWAVVRFDSIAGLDDLANPYAYPRNSVSPLTIDSVDIAITHENTTGTNDTIQVSIYPWTGALGFQVNGQEEIVTAPIFDTLIVTNTSLTNGPNSLGIITVYPDLTLTYPNNRFSVGVHFYGDTLNTFTVLATYGEQCGGACAQGQGASTSAFELNSFWRIIAWAGGGTVDLTGINSIGYDCDNDNIVGEPEECEEYTIQNFSFVPYVTIDPQLTSTITASDNSICPGETINLSVTPVGGTGPYTVSWEPLNAGLTSPFSPTTNASPTTTTTFTATIIDSNSPADTITKTVLVNVNAITVSINDVDLNIGCGQTTNLDSVVVGGTVAGATFAWSNSVNTLTNPNVGSGTYTITATNSFGCSASDAATITIPGVTQVLNFNTGLANNIGCQDEAINFENTSTNLTGWDWSWTFGDNGNISFAQDPSYTYTGTGTYTVTLSADSGGCSVSSISKIVTIEICGGIEESWLSTHVEMYPNPTTGLVTLNFKDIDAKAGKVGIYDITGKLAVEEMLSVAGSAQKVIDLSSLADGVYFVKIQLGDGVTMRRLNVTR